MDTIEVPSVCALALNNLPIVGRPIWRLTEGKHIVKLEITRQLPRTQTPRQINQHRSTAKKPADGVTGGVIKMADKMAEKKMAAPTRKMEDDELNVAVCSTPSTPQHSMASPEGLSITHSSVDTTTDHSPEGEWKEVVSRKMKKKLSLSPPKSPPVKTKKEDPNVRPGRKTPPPPPKKPRVRSPLKEQEKMIAGDGRQYPPHEKYDLDEVVTDQQPNKTKYIIIRAYRQLREEEKFNVDLPAYFIRFLGTSEWYLAKGPTSKYYHETNYNDIEERFKRAGPVDNAIRWYDDLDHSCQGTDPAAAQVLKITSTCPSC